MGRISFENFGTRAKYLKDNTSIAGRYSIQKEAEKYIIMDIIQKLNIEPKDVCLDIGCGPGNILIPLSFFVKKITGIDHNSVIEKLKARISDLNNIELIPGNFLDLNINNNFSKIIVYSVLHYLENEKEVLEFINKTVTLLVPGGKILFGDIPNESKKKRFLSSPQGKEFIKEWEQKVAKSQIKDDFESSILKKLSEDNKLVKFDDTFIFKIIKLLRDSGYHTYIYPQLPELPFGYTREDILIEKTK